MKKIALYMALCCVFLPLVAQEWSGTSIPADPGSGKVWELISNVSDDFNYSSKGDGFYDRWKDSYIAGWLGPGQTYWKSDHTWMDGDNVVIKASRNTSDATRVVNCGIFSSTAEVMYPVYMEVKMKINGLKLSSNFWLLSQDSRNEIDVNETYGADDPGGKYMGTNYHIFERDANTNSIIKDWGNSSGKHTASGSPFLKNAYHRFGAYWKNAWTVEFYLDGIKVRTMTVTDNYQNKGLDRAMKLIIDTEDHTWRSNDGIVCTDSELANGNINKMYVDWVRCYKPVNSSSSGSTFYIVNKETGKKIRNSGSVDGAALQLVPSSWNGDRQRFTKIDTDNGYFYLKNVESGMYFRPTDNSDGSELIQRPTSYDGSYTQWKQVTSSGDYFYLKNRSTSKYFRPETDADYSTITQRPTTSTGNWTQWKFIDVNSGEALKSVQTPMHSSSDVTAKDIEIYPNPVSNGLVTIKTGNHQDNVIINIFDLSGKIVYNNIVEDENIQLSVDKLTRGIYMVKIQSSNGTSIQKLVID